LNNTQPFSQDLIAVSDSKDKMIGDIHALFPGPTITSIYIYK